MLEVFLVLFLAISDTAAASKSRLLLQDGNITAENDTNSGLTRSEVVLQPILAPQNGSLATTSAAAPSAARARFQQAAEAWRASGTTNASHAANMTAPLKPLSWVIQLKVSSPSPADAAAAALSGGGSTAAAAKAARQAGSKQAAEARGVGEGLVAQLQKQGVAVAHSKVSCCA